MSGKEQKRRKTSIGGVPMAACKHILKNAATPIRSAKKPLRVGVDARKEAKKSVKMFLARVVEKAVSLKRLTKLKTYNENMIFSAVDNLGICGLKADQVANHRRQSRDSDKIKSFTTGGITTAFHKIAGDGPEVRISESAKVALRTACELYLKMIGVQCGYLLASSGNVTISEDDVVAARAMLESK